MDHTSKDVVHVLESLQSQQGGAVSFKLSAEGVETDEHIAYLSNKGCYEYKGYYYSKPLSVKSVQPC
ncbi:hypothetical protein [Halobacillus naozhouensis]|uniref:EAL domain-containing protein n=1 Tax=Halobacillus naozhouensis TaxID=554880 RepID=A0ABY8IYM3_9BACI|nr:hypothetical protein [Halobacillus naozhouensis]WFT75175.1 hypothetical protein P9989_01840 [Halobacillus naozhouensis]